MDHQQCRSGREQCGNEDKAASGVPSAGCTHVAREEDECRDNGCDLRNDEPAIRERRVERVEDELPEHRCVFPTRRRRGGVRQPVWDRPRGRDLLTKRCEPARVGPDLSQQCHDGSDCGVLRTR